MSNSSSWPWPSRATTPSTSPACSSNETSCSLRPGAQARARRAAVRRRPRAPPALDAARAAARLAGSSPRVRPASARRSGPRSPRSTSTTPTVSPSRRTVARSQTAAISMRRWEMKMTERSEPRWLPMTSSTRSVRFGRQRGGHLVEHQDVRLDREGARQVDDPQRREGQVAGDSRRGRGRRCPARASQWRNGSIGVFGQAQVGADVEVRDERRLLVDRDDAAAPGLGGGAGAVRLAADGDRAAVGTDRAGEDLDERALAGAVGAHQRVDLAGPDGQRRDAQGRDRAVALGDAGRVEQQIGATVVTSAPVWRMGRSGSGDAGGADIPVTGLVRGVGLLARALAGDELVLGVRGPVLDRQPERPQLRKLRVRRGREGGLARRRSCCPRAPG